VGTRSMILRTLRDVRWALMPEPHAG
jgi:hypothetical protein